MTNFIDDGDGIDEFFEDIKKRKVINNNRFEKFENWLKLNDFDKLMYRLILEHGDEWREKCWHNGYEPHPNNKLNFLFNYVVEKNEPVKIPELDNVFNNEIFEFKGYYFQMTYGQGVCFQIFNKDDLKLLLSL